VTSKGAKNVTLKL